MTHVVTSETVQIEAPAAFVWEVLVDYERYPQWNPYTVAATTTLQVGAPIDLTLPPYDDSGEPFTTREFIRIVESPHHLRYDSGDELPGVVGVRDQRITEVGPGRCIYDTSVALSGENADLALHLTGDWIQAGIDAVATALKDRAESLRA